MARPHDLTPPPPLSRGGHATPIITLCRIANTCYAAKIMVLAYHTIFAAYGFWLPNDPRGSWSAEVWAKHLRPFGPATKTTEQRSLAHRPHDRRLRLEAKAALKHPAVTFDELQRRCIGRGFAQIIRVLDLPVYACAIMPDHAHLVFPRHDLTVEEIVGFLKRAATRQLTKEGMHPLAGRSRESGKTPSPWVVGGWNRYLNDEQAIADAMWYVWRNPVRAGLGEQHWRFVVPFEGVKGGIAWPRRLNDVVGMRIE